MIHCFVFVAVWADSSFFVVRYVIPIPSYLLRAMERFVEELSDFKAYW
jgi:hypothetical protein